MGFLFFFLGTLCLRGCLDVVETVSLSGLIFDPFGR